MRTALLGTMGIMLAGVMVLSWLMGDVCVGLFSLSAMLAILSEPR
jgi:hypothetical protein